jgi:flagellar hook-length control protein FliK
MIVDRMNMDSFREAMNNSYLPSSVAVVSENNATNTVKTFEDDSFDKNLNKELDNLDNIIGQKNNDSYLNSIKSDDRVNENENYRDNEPHRNSEHDSKDADNHIKNQQDNSNSDDNPNNIDSNDKKKHDTEKVSSSEQEKTTAEKNAKSNKSEGTTKSNEEFKEHIKQQIAQAKELGNIKENAGENKNTANTGNLSKTVIDNLEKQHTKQTQDKNNSQNQQQNKAENETSSDQRLKDPDIEKNDSKTSFKQELKTAKKNAATDLTFSQVDNIKDPQQLNDIKIKKALAQQSPNLLEQYQGIKEKITGSVENSIKMLVANGENRVTMNLHPPELGKVQVELVIKDSQINAKINTENVAVKEVIMSNLDQLKSNLANAGTQVNKFDVEVGGFKSQFEQQTGFNRNGSGSGKGKGGNGNGYQSGQDSGDLQSGQIMNNKALTFFLGRSINCLI